MDNVLNLEAIMKAGAINATDVALNGALNVKQGKAFANAIVDDSKLLKTITVDVTKGLTKDRSALTTSKGMLVRHVAGKALTDAQLRQLGVVGARLNMVNGVTLQMNITDEALDDNQDNPQFEDEQFSAATTTFSNDLVYLGWIGVADNTTELAPFNELSKGWMTVAAEATDSLKSTVSIAAITGGNGAVVEACLQKLIDTAHEDITDDMTIFLSKKDYSDYVRMIAKDYQAVSILKSGDFLEFEGRKLMPQKGIPQGSFLGTPEKNMVLGLSRAIDRKRWYSNEISSLCYKFVVRPDYEFDIKKYTTLVTTVA
jgi:hypothetical protein